MGDLQAAGLVGEIGGAYLIITGILIRAGIYRGWLGGYRDTCRNVVQRRGVLARVPLGLAALAASTAVAFNWNPVVVVLLWSAAAACFVAWLLLALACPPWRKPSWLVRAERLGWPDREERGGILTVAVKAIGVLILVALIYALWTPSNPNERIGPLISAIGVLLYQLGKGRLGRPRVR